MAGRLVRDMRTLASATGDAPSRRPPRPRVNPVREPAVEMYTAPGCSFCETARSALTSLGVEWLEYDVESEAESSDVERRGRHARFNTVPQLYVVYQQVEEHIGGCSELMDEIEKGSFVDRLKNAKINFPN
eukprot:CAMPEP_0198208616 /NCGR_PEP_ID=MMETSP1445-20131203/11951_1 /TAXON_ID=36898 /ORGANISM="Pyramimonas sp., Strain CCMP2087" /LENGTH=130 /DNA_ID=CAMNT_0043882075 /DNA_START=200 /DNA_END=592 /DNA_ORIENTATION=+